MKKWMLLATLFLASAGTSLYAQPPGGGQMSPEQRNAMMKERFKAMGCDDVQADSLIAISNDMRPKQMALRDLEPEARQAKMKEIKAAAEANGLKVGSNGLKVGDAKKA